MRGDWSSRGLTMLSLSNTTPSCVSRGLIRYGELRRQVRNVARALLDLGVQPGDRVAAYIPNVPEAVVAMLATMGIGALWSSCSPDFGVSSVLDRFRQIEPKVLLVVDGYRYGGKDFDRRTAVDELIQSLSSIESVIHLPYLFSRPGRRQRAKCTGVRGSDRS